ncbi:MAG: type II toxin-antitoxin system BrnA family antitoxin [Chthoniobacterales bacterium]
MTAEQLDEIFDKGEEDILPYLDLAKAVRPGHQAKRVNVDFPSWMISPLDFEADRLGVPRQSLIKVWIAERLAASRQKVEQFGAGSA